MRFARVVAVAACATVGSPAPPASPIAFNDNLTPAGVRRGGVLELSLVAQVGVWRPLGADRPGTPILSFGEAGKGPTDPGPLVRVPAGTTVHVTVRNASDRRIVVHGFAARRTAVMDSLVVPAGGSAETRFAADAPGSYFYWGSTHGEALNDRILEDAHLNGAFIVDPAGTHAPDRVFVIERWVPDTTADGNPDYPREMMTVNGRPWPYTERLTYDVGDSVRWRLINVSQDYHPFHLHGFFYRIDARGDFARDTTYWPAQQRLAVTELMVPGSTLRMAWRPDRPGGWIFHCHFPPHVWANAGVPPDTEPLATRIRHVLNGYPDSAGMSHERQGMGGLVLGIYIRPPAGWRPYAGAGRTERLVVATDSEAGDSTRRLGYVLGGGDPAGERRAIGADGPPLVLTRGEPTRIWVVNHGPEPTQVHWHGLEIESAYDGVGGTSGVGPQRARMIMPGDSTAVLLVSPRAGTFIYHTHLNDIHQLLHGLYGPLIVLDSGERWNPDRDRVFIVGDDAAEALVLNGGRNPDTAALTAGVPYRFRLINMAAFDPVESFTLVRHGAPVRWTALAKDGADLPPWQRARSDARQTVSVGETYDFVVQLRDTGAADLEVRDLDGTLRTRQPLHFRP